MPRVPPRFPALLEAGIPVFGMCYGFQAMAMALGGEVARTGLREYGHTIATVADTESTPLRGQPAEQSVWMSHGDLVAQAPAMSVTASTAGAPVAAFEDDGRRLYGVQWHPEVLHSTFGQSVLEHFLRDGAGLRPDWDAGCLGDREQVALIRERVGDKRVICGLSGASIPRWRPRWCTGPSVTS